MRVTINLARAIVVRVRGICGNLGATDWRLGVKLVGEAG